MYELDSHTLDLVKNRDRTTKEKRIALINLYFFYASYLHSMILYGKNERETKQRNM